MRLAILRTAICVAGLILAFTSFAQDNVRAYAAFCYGELGVTPTDLENTMGRLGSACYYGTKLTTTHEGIELERIPLGDRQSPNFLKTCDAPAWLNSGVVGADKQCYGGSYITPLEITDASGNLRTDVKGALLCRHKTRDPRLDTRGFPAEDDYDDVAMILHNKNSGKTCWFQTQDGETAFLDGRAVLPPHLDTTNFWLPPSRTGAIKCARCHDNGPWMNSQWLYTAHQGFKDGLRKYETPKYGTTAFHDWKATDDFVTVGRTGIQNTELQKCNSCHKLSARVDWDPAAATDRYNGTYENWFDFSAGRKQVPQATVTEPGRASKATDYLYTHWMPTYFERHPPTPIEDLRPPDAATYDRQYKKHLTELKLCMETPRADRHPPSPCKTTTAMLNNTAPSGTGATVSATVVETGLAYTATAAAAGTAPAPATTVLPLGQSLQLGWQADATYDGCSIEATMPEGVVVPVSGGSAPDPISSGSGWELPDAPPLVGPLTEPGVYEFAIYCRDTHTASLRFQAGTTGPRSLVKLVTSVNKTIQATAISSQNMMQPVTTTNVSDSDSVELTWIAYNVLPNSCVLQGPATNSADEAGSKTLAFSSSTNQVFMFQCTGANDGVTRSVSSTLHPAGKTSPPVLLGAVARKVHGAAGTFDLPLSLDFSAPSTEPRQGPSHSIVFTFDKPITGATIAVSEGTATPDVPDMSGNDLIVNLTGVINQQYVAISLTNVSSSDGGIGGTGSARVGFLAGDVNGNRVVSLADVGQVNAQLAQQVSAANFLKDVNVSGTLSLADKAIANANLTKALLPP